MEQMNTCAPARVGEERPPRSGATIAWSIVAALVPVNSALPGPVRGLFFAAIGILLVFPVLSWRIARPLYYPVWVIAGYGIIGATLVSGVGGPIVSNVFVGAQLLLLLGFGPYVLTYATLQDQKFTNRVALAFVAGQSFSALTAVTEFQSIAVPTITDRSAGLTEAVNTLGLMAGLAVLICIRILMATRAHFFLVLPALLINALGLITSGSLTAALGVCLGALVLVLGTTVSIGRAVGWSIAAALAIGLAIAAAGPSIKLPSLGDRYLQVTGQTRGVSTWEIRKSTYDAAWATIERDPLYGQGLNGKYSAVLGGLAGIHNFILRAWYQGGILLCFVFVLIAAAILAVIIRSAIRRQDGGEASVLVALFVYACFSPVLEQRTFWIPALLAWASISAKEFGRLAPAKVRQTGRGVDVKSTVMPSST